MNEKRGCMGCLISALIALALVGALIFGAVRLVRGLFGAPQTGTWHQMPPQMMHTPESPGTDTGTGSGWFEIDPESETEQPETSLPGTASTDIPEASVPEGAEDPGTTGGPGQSGYTTDYSGFLNKGSSMTVMIYMIGSNLESESGCATADIQEMCYARLGSHVNVVLEAGGAKRWRNPTMADGQVGRYSLASGTLQLQQELGAVSMTRPGELTDFVSWAAAAYPADRYGLILWDHGGGTLLGFGSDEVFPRGTITLSDLHSALGQANVHFDFVGFDACLMGTVETAFALADYADYLIAAEETEPGEGWYYTGWLSFLGSNPGVNMEVLGKRIVDDYVSRSRYYEQTTLSLIRLDKIGALYSALSKYLTASGRMLEDTGYARISGARSAARSFGEGEYEQIDIISYLKAAGSIEGSDEVMRAVKNAVIYTSGNIADANGLAMYYPYNQLWYYSGVMEMLSSMGYNNPGYVRYFDTFVGDLAYGQYYGLRSLSPAEQLTGYTDETPVQDYTDEYWFQEEQQLDSDAALLTEEQDAEFLVLTEKGDDYVLSLPADRWDAISQIEMCLMVDDGEGYLDLGTRTDLQYDQDGDLVLDFDFLWMGLDPELPAPFYVIEDKTDSTGFRHILAAIPAELNGESDIEILCHWDDDHPEGVVKGYRFAREDSEAAPLYQRNVNAFQPGDEIRYYCDYYSYDGDYEGSYYISDPIQVHAGGLKPQWVELNEDVLIYFHLRDLYQNDYWTEGLLVTPDW